MFAWWLACVLSVPFVDTQGRFTIDLPESWAFAPQPGDVTGAYFRKTTEQTIANVAVRVIPFTTPTDLPAFMGSIVASSNQEPGYRLLLNTPTVVEDTPAVRRRYVVSINGDKMWFKQVEQVIFVRGSKGYVLHAETIAEAFSQFSADFEHMFLSFHIGRPLQKAALTNQVSQPLTLQQLVGTWQAHGHTLTLSPGGIVVFDDISGQYRLDSGLLILKFSTTTDVYEINLRNNILEITGGNFKTGLAFVKQSNR